MKKLSVLAFVIITIFYFFTTTLAASHIYVVNDTELPVQIHYAFDDKICRYRVPTIAPGKKIRLKSGQRELPPKAFGLFDNLRLLLLPKNYKKKHISVLGHPAVKVQSGQKITVSSLPRRASGDAIIVPRGFYLIINDTKETQEFIYHFTTDDGGESMSIQLEPGRYKLSEHKGKNWDGQIQIKDCPRHTIKSGETWEAS